MDILSGGRRRNLKVCAGQNVCEESRKKKETTKTEKEKSEYKMIRTATLEGHYHMTRTTARKDPQISEGKKASVKRMERERESGERGKKW